MVYNVGFIFELFIFLGWFKHLLVGKIQEFVDMLNGRIFLFHFKQKFFLGLFELISSELKFFVLFLKLLPKGIIVSDLLFKFLEWNFDFNCREFLIGFLQISLNSWDKLNESQA